MRRAAIEFCRRLAHLHQVRLLVYDRKGAGAMKVGGLASPERNRIQLYVGGLDHHEIVSVFFHELAHIRCAREGIYASFHGGDPLSRARATVYHGLQAERYVDALGEAMCREWLGKTIKWKKAYSTSGEDLWFKVNQVLPHYLYLKTTGGFSAKRKHRRDGDQDGQAA